MGIIEIFHGFDFNQYGLSHDHIGSVLADNNALIHYFECLLALDLDTALPQFERQRVLIDPLQKSMSERIRDVVSATDDALSNRIQICVHLCPSVDEVTPFSAPPPGPALTLSPPDKCQRTARSPNSAPRPGTPPT